MVVRSVGWIPVLFTVLAVLVPSFWGSMAEFLPAFFAVMAVLVVELVHELH